MSLSKENITFLKELQKEMANQDTCCQADPRFWVIAAYRTRLDRSGDAILWNSDIEEEIVNLEEALDYLRYKFENSDYSFIMSSNCNSISVFKNEIQYSYLYSLHDVLEFFEDDSWDLLYVTKEHYICENTLFLTKKSCEEHISKYGYNYIENPHPFAMTAVRSPEVEKLYSILQETNWDDFDN